MELTPLRYFIAMADAGHMTHAAETLGVTQPALSAMLKKLEAEVGTDLFHRTGRGVSLTEAGAIFLQHARDALRKADEGVKAVRELLGLERGSIRIGGGATATTYLLPHAISRFRTQYPNLTFYVREAGSSAVAQAVLDGELDIGIVTLPLTLPGHAELLRTPLVEDELRLILPPGHPLAGKRSFRWKDLADAPVVGFEAGSAVRELLDRAAAAADAGVTLRYVMELRSIESIKQMVAAGIGVGFVSRFAVAPAHPASTPIERAPPHSPPPGRTSRKPDADAATADHELSGLECKDGRLTRSLVLIRRRDRNPSPATRAFEQRLIAVTKGA